MVAASTTIAARLTRGALTIGLCAGVVPWARAADPPNVEANRHFQNGVTAFRAQRFVEAVDEFAWAYRIAPAFQVLYNIGQVDAMLERHAEAIRAFSAYIAEGGAAVAPSRRAEVEAQMLRLRSLVGAVRVAISPAAAIATIDGAAVPSGAPGRPVFVEPGRHTVSAALPGYRAEMRELTVAPGSDVALELLLQPLSIASNPPPLVLAEAPLASDSARAPRAPEPWVVRPSHDHPQRAAAYVVGAGGAALLLAGSLLALTGAGRANTARERLAQASTGSAWDTAKVDYDGGAKQNDIGWVVAGVGAASATAAVLLYVTTPRSSRSLSVGLAAVPSPLAGRAAVVGSW